MDLKQTKLTKSEWMNIEIPVSDQEKSILQLIIDGYHDVNLRRNDNVSLLSHMKMEYSPEIEKQLYKQYFEKDVDALVSKHMPNDSDSDDSSKPSKKPNKKQKKDPPMKTRDLIRIQSMDAKLDQDRAHIFEFLVLEFCREILKGSKPAFYLYTLIQIKKATIPLVNKHVMEFVDRVISKTVKTIEMRDVLRSAYEFIEKNRYLLKYEDKTLFDHQKQLFSIFRQAPLDPKLVLYIAPTGTGKTLSPLGLAEKHRVIFVCAARHVGLALAKSAISVGKRVAFAFGCDTASDIRLHYFAASVYSKHRKTGGIYKVDNSVGDKVQIMICDVQSYLTAMHYMLAFSPLLEDETGTPLPKDADLITYWDEPTISMDYAEHDLHPIIHRNWTENRISKMVLSCATLPKEREILDTITDFRQRFDGAQIHSIESYDCRKSIAVLNKTGHSVLPHLLFKDYDQLQTCVEHCENNKTLLRYFDLQEIIQLIEKAQPLIPEQYKSENYFNKSIAEITMNSLKLYYLKVLRNIGQDYWTSLFEDLSRKQTPKFAKTGITKTKSVDLSKPLTCSQPFASMQPLARSQSLTQPKGSQPLSRQQSVAYAPISQAPAQSASNGILLTTEDAHTLTDGPTIFLAEDVNKIGKFYIQQTNIPAKIFQGISDKIAQNSALQQKIDILTKTLEDKASGELDKEKKIERDQLPPEVKRIMEQIEAVRGQIKSVAMEPVYIPNTTQHQRVWVTTDTTVQNAFVPAVDEESVKDIMGLDVSDQMKLLLLLGIGVFTKDASIISDASQAESKSGQALAAERTSGHLAYMEIMKRLAYQQRLFLILASSDYIYGTNYQFCHGFIGKDLNNMTQQKTIQAMGRIGRNQMQQEYTIRFRDDAMLTQLFQAPTVNPEAEVMSRLFSQ
jgi:hypothetical protein